MKITDIPEFTNTLIEGGAGCGKTESIIKPVIANAINQGKAGVVSGYDDSDLSKVAYYSFVEKKKCDPNYNLEFALFNLIDFKRTVRVNVLSEKYFNKINERSYFQNIAAIILFKFYPLWKKQKDQFYFGCVEYISSVAYLCYRQRENGINTFPHVISICLSDSDLVFKWLSADEKTKSVQNYFKNIDLNEKMGCLTLVKSALMPLQNRNVYWVLSPQAEEEFSLDITNKEKPVLFFVDNLSRINNYSSSILSTIFEIVVNQMNYTGKADSIFCIDDFSDLSFSFENFIMTNNRNHRISTYIAMQNLAQFETRYREGEQLRGKFENQFLGLGGCAIQKEQGTNMELLNLPNKRKKRFQFNLISIYINCNLKEKKHQETLPKDFQPEFYSVGEFSFKNYDLKDVIKFCSYDGGTAEIPEFFSVTEEDVNINYDRINREVKELLEH